MRTRLQISALAAAAALALTACGGDDDDGDTATDPSAATVATTTTSSSAGEMTAGEYLAAPIPEMSQAVKDLVAEHPEECEGIDPKDGGKFQQAFAIDAATAPPDTPLSEIIVESCEENLAGKGTA